MINWPIHRVNFEAGIGCRLKCGGCMMRHQMKPGSLSYKDMAWDRRYNIPLEKYKVIFEVFDDYEFCGNLSDPIYHPDFVKTLKYMKGKNIKVNFRTNGGGKSKEWWSNVFELCQGENWLWTFALDGLPEDSHKYRINQDGEQVWEMMKYGKELGMEILWQWIVFNYNQDAIKEGHLLAAQYGIDFDYYHSTRWVDDRDIGGVDMSVYKPKEEHVAIKRSEMHKQDIEFNSLMPDGKITKAQYAAGVKTEDVILEAIKQSGLNPEIDPDCLNRELTKPIMFNSMGYFIPCCEKDQWVESMEKRGFYQEKFHIDNLHTAEDVINVFASDTWQDFYKGLYDDAKNAPRNCKTFCVKNRNIRNEDGSGIDLKGFV